LFCQDESRFGLKTIQRKRITLKGIKPKGAIQDEYENFYIFGAVEPKTGSNFFLECPEVNGGCFQVFLESFAQEYKNSLNIMILDNARFHLRKKTRIPENVVLIYLPPYSPELNPIERVWKYFKDQISWQVFGNIEGLRNKVYGLIKYVHEDTIKSLTSYDYLLKALAA
jgi:hypothetical protein